MPLFGNSKNESTPVEYPEFTPDYLAVGLEYSNQAIGSFVDADSELQVANTDLARSLEKDSAEIDQLQQRVRAEIDQLQQRVRDARDQIARNDRIRAKIKELLGESESANNGE